MRTPGRLWRLGRASNTTEVMENIMAQPAKVYHLPNKPRRQPSVNSWRWNELEEDVLDDLPHVCQIIYLRIMRKHMDYSTGIVGRTRRISYEQIKERLRYTPPPQSREKAVEYSTDQVKKLIRKLVSAGLLERLHDTSSGVQPMEFRLPLACNDLDSQGHDRATVTGPHENPHGRASGEGNRATTGPREIASQGHPSGSGKELLPKGSNDSSKKSPPRKWGDEIDHELATEMVAAVSADLDAPIKHNPTTWANEFRLMRERDGRTVEQIRYLITWTAKHDFWSGVILSPAKLRAKWDQLAKQVKQSAKPSKQTPGRHSGLQAPDTSSLVEKGDGTYEF